MIERIFELLYRDKRFKWFMAIYMAVAVVGGITMALLDKNGFIKLQTTSLAFDEIETLEGKLAKFEKQLVESQQAIQKINSIDSELVSEVAQFVSKLGVEETQELTTALSRVNEISGELEMLDERVTDLSGALNPTTPKEVLTLARLGDHVKNLDSDIKELKSQFSIVKSEMSKDIDRNHELVVKEIDRIVGLFQWLGILLIPIILNTLRDIFRPKQDSKESEGSA